MKIKIKVFQIGFLLFAALTTCWGQQLTITQSGSAYAFSVSHQGKTLLTSPEEGLWSIATAWENDWCANWLQK